MKQFCIVFLYPIDAMVSNIVLSIYMRSIHLPNGKVKLELVKNFKHIKGNIPKFLTRKVQINMCQIYHQRKVHTSVSVSSPKA